MDTLSLSYFLELTKDLHFTNTAERLFISQQTLSNHIHRLEEDLGTILIDRTQNKALTQSGKLLKDFAQKALQADKDLRAMVDDINQETRGQIFFGAPSLRMNSLIPVILPKFTQKYPMVKIHLTERLSEKLIKLMEDGNLDLALVVSFQNGNQISNDPSTFQDRLYYCVRDSLLEKHFKENKDKLINESLSGVDLKAFADIPICMLNNNIGQLIMEIFDQLHVTPNVYIYSSSLQTCTNIGYKGQAAFLATRTSIALQSENYDTEEDPIYVFPINYNGKPLSQTMSLVVQKNQYQPQYLVYFKELIQEHINSLEATPLPSIPIETNLR